MAIQIKEKNKLDIKHNLHQALNPYLKEEISIHEKYYYQSISYKKSSQFGFKLLIINPIINCLMLLINKKTNAYNIQYEIAGKLLE